MAWLTKSGRSWSIRFRSPDGKMGRISVSKLAGHRITRKMEAEEVLARWISERGTRFAPTVQGSLQEAQDRYLRYAAQHMTADTFRSEATRLKAFIDWCHNHGIHTPEQVSPIAIAEFKNERMSEITATTMNRYLERARAFFNQLVEWRYVTHNPFERVRLLKVHVKEPRHLTDEEIVRLLAIAEGDLRDGIIIALQTGCREAELVRIEWADIKPDGIHLKKTKSYRPRTMPWAPGMSEVVERRRAARTPESRFLFDNGQSGELWNSNGWYHRLHVAYLRSGIDGANFHSLRHTFATRLVRNNVNIKIVQHLMGHADIATTMRYVHLYAEDSQEAVARLDLPDAASLGRKC